MRWLVKHSSFTYGDDVYSNDNNVSGAKPLTVTAVKGTCAAQNVVNDSLMNTILTAGQTAYISEVNIYFDSFWS